MHGIIVGPPRVTPSSGAQVDGHYVLPKVCPGQSLSWELRIEWLTLHEQTVVTTSSFYCHMQSEVFPKPEKFKPERWLNPTPEMEKYLVPFSKSKRMCPGKESVPVFFLLRLSISRAVGLIGLAHSPQDIPYGAVRCHCSRP